MIMTRAVVIKLLLEVTYAISAHLLLDRANYIVKSNFTGARRCTPAPGKGSVCWCNYLSVNLYASIHVNKETEIHLLSSYSQIHYQRNDYLKRFTLCKYFVLHVLRMQISHFSKFYKKIFFYSHRYLIQGQNLNILQQKGCHIYYSTVRIVYSFG